MWLAVVAPAIMSEAEAGGSRVKGQAGLHNEMISNGEKK